MGAYHIRTIKCKNKSCLRGQLLHIDGRQSQECPYCSGRGTVCLRWSEDTESLHRIMYQGVPKEAGQTGTKGHTF